MQSSPITSPAGIFRTCDSCSEIKPLGDFGQHRRGDKTYYRHTCRSCYNQRRRLARAQHPEQQREYDRRSYKKHREAVIERKMVLNAKRRAWMHGITAVTDVRLDDLVERDGTACYLCGVDLDRSEMQMDHVIPLSRGGSHTPGNMRIACRTCNFRKGNYLLSEIDLETLKPTIKDCAHCGQIKPISEFYTAAHTWNKHCKSCAASLMRQQRSTLRNISIVDTHAEVYRCNTCATEWTPQPEDGIENMRWYWRCPNGCNHDGKAWGPGERTCSHCGEVKPVSEFAGRGKNRRSECKQCCAALARQSRAASHNLSVVDSRRDLLRCNTCEEMWAPYLKPGQKQIRYWWRCPNGCNHQ